MFVAVFCLTFCMLENFTCLFVFCKFSLKSSNKFFIVKKSSLDPDPALYFVRPNLGPNYMKSYQRATKVTTTGERNYM